MYAYVPECIYVYHMCAGAQGSQKSALAFLELELVHPPYGCWELDLGLLQEQALITAEMALQPLFCGFVCTDLSLSLVRITQKALIILNVTTVFISF